jgi:hypothetical protein
LSECRCKIFLEIAYNNINLCVGCNEIQKTRMTEKEKRDYLKRVDENIRTCGYHMTFVFADKSPSFCYSTGIYKSFNIPEIFISSLSKNLSFELIDSYVQLFKQAKLIPVGSKIDNITDKFPVYLIEVPKPNLQDYALATVRYYRSKNYEYIQMIYPDTAGHFPNDKDYDYDQEIMGTFDN